MTDKERDELLLQIAADVAGTKLVGEAVGGPAAPSDGSARAVHSLFVTSCDSTTVVEHVSRLLLHVEQLLGPRDLAYTFVGVVISGSDPSPHIYYPPPKGIGHVMIKLGKRAADDVKLALWQLAHECVHLIDPCVAGQATWLEEGLATWFQNTRVRDIPAEGAYSEAEELVTKYLPNILCAVKDFRTTMKKPIRSMERNYLLENCAGMVEDDATKLCSPFPV